MEKVYILKGKKGKKKKRRGKEGSYEKGRNFTRPMEGDGGDKERGERWRSLG